MKRKNIEFDGIFNEGILFRAAEIIDKWARFSVSKQYTGKHVGYKFFMRVMMEHGDDVNFLHGCFGGYLNVQDKGNGRVLYWWNVQDGRTIAIFRLLRDKLKTRNDMIDLIFDLKKLISRGSYKKLTIAQKDAREDLFNQISVLQKKQIIWVKNEDGTYYSKF